MNSASSGSSSGYSSNTVSNATVSEPTFWDKVFGATDKIVTHEPGKPAPQLDRVITVRDATASAGQQVMNTDAEYYRTSQAGNQTFIQKIGTSVLSILTHT
jgi:hypothetical protein